MKRATQRDRDEFAAYCANLTVSQIENVIVRERMAGRLAYQRIAESELDRRDRAPPRPRP